MTHEYFSVLIAPLRMVARRCGYALGVHGSLQADIDLIAVPWRESAVCPETLIEDIRIAAEAIIGICEMPNDHKPTIKPCGRLAWALRLTPLGCDGPYLDISVFGPVKV